MAKLVKDCLYPEALRSLGTYGPALGAMTLEEFVAAYRKHMDLPNYKGRADLPDTQEVYTKGGVLKAAAQAMGLPIGSDNSYVVPGPDWLSRKDQEALDAEQAEG